MEKRKQILSCIQPTGDIHYGNYFGAVKNWVQLQKDYDCVYGVVDYHAMTAPYSPKKLRENTWELIFNLLAVGIEADNLFIQSLIPEHAELCWIFNCYTSYGQLSRMTQFKDKSKNQQNSDDSFISAGLLDYPVLQAADILIYRADYVPVGKDQEQHLELSRNIAQRFNNQVGKEYFILPETLFTKTPKILSTADPSRKMSKSAGEKHYISLFKDDENRIRKKIRSAVTDTGETTNGEMSAGVKNLFTILEAAEKQEEYDQLLSTYQAGNLKYSELKESVANCLVELSAGFQQKKQEILTNKKEVKNQIKYSSAQIRKTAQQTIREVKELCGIMNVKF